MPEAIVVTSDRAPSLSGAPWLGVLRSLLHDPLAVYEQARDLADVVRLPLPFGAAYLVSAPALIQEVLQDRAVVFRRPPLLQRLLRSVGGDNLMTLEGEAWLARRRSIQPHLRRSEVAALAEEILEAIDASLETWLPCVGGELNLHERLVTLTQEIVSRTLLGVSLGEAPGVGAAFETMTAYLAYRASNPFAAPLWLPTARNRGMRRAQRFLDEVASQILARRRAAASSRADLLSTLMQVQGLTDEELQREVQVMIGAGETTTSQALTFCFALLGSHPEELARVSAQIDDTVGPRRVTLADLEHLTRLRQVLSETLRLYPPSYVFARAPVESVQLGGVTLRRGSTLLISPYALHRDRRWWSEPARFQPDRFDARGAPVGVPRYAYLPFGGGARRCVGEHLAQLEMMLTVARILQRFRLVLPRNPAPRLRAGFALGLADGLTAQLALR